MSPESPSKLPEAPPQLQWVESVHSSNTTVLAGNQYPRAELRLNLQLYSYRRDRRAGTPVEKYIWISLDGTKVSPGALAVNRLDKRGFYTETVALEMGFTDDNGIEIAKDAPSSSEEGGSISNTLSYSFSAGFFGDTFTGSAGTDISHSVSQTLPNFEFFNNSDNSTVRHRSELRLVDGKVYRRPPDLVQNTLTSSLGELPPLAVSNFPMISQVLFRAPQGLSQARTLYVAITHRLVQVEKTVVPLGFLTGRSAVGYDDNRRDETQRVIRTELTIDIAPATVNYRWEFRIPFNQV